MNKLIDLDLTVEVDESICPLEVMQKITRMLLKRGGIESLSIGVSNVKRQPIRENKKHIDN